VIFTGLLFIPYDISDSRFYLKSILIICQKNVYFLIIVYFYKKNIMKKIIISFFFLCLALNLAIAQKMSDEQFNSLSEANKELYLRLVSEQNQREARINAYLLSNKDVKRRYIAENGGEYEIKDILNGHPIYFSTDNVAAAQATKTDQLQVGGALGLDLDGNGMVVGVWDGGPVQSTHPEFSTSIIDSRVTVLNTDTPDGSAAFSNHGTHVAGTIGASGVDPAAKGMATDVDIKSYSWTNDYAEMLGAATDLVSPIVLSNHSYGVPVTSYVNSGQEWVMGAYIQDSRNADELVYNNPQYLPVYSAGNNGLNTYSGQSIAGLDKLTGDKTAKNVLVIANANPVVSSGNLVALSINSGSSQGPTDDFRIKPDIAADGTNLYSPTTGNTYSVFSGTSMAAPNTTGTLVLLQQYYSQLNAGSFMKASTVKALVCHTTVDDPLNPGPDPHFGWGFLDARASAETITGDNNGTAVIDELSLSNNDVYTYTFNASAGQRLSATIAWTDVPGTISNGTLNDPTPALVNDLDLRITKDGTEYMPWRLSLSLIGGVGNSQGDNTVDNVERIDIETPESGQYTLTVSHKGTLQGASNKQDFSLILTGNNLTLSTDDISLSDNMSLYPNPTNDYFDLNFAVASESDITVKIYDINARLVNEKVFNNYSNSIFNERFQTDDLANGIYMVRVSSGNRSATKKLIIN